MTFLLTDVFRSAQSRFAFKAELGTKKQRKSVLVDANGWDMTVWNIEIDSDPNQRPNTYLSKCHTLPFSSIIQAMASYRDEFGNTIMVVVGDNSLVFYELTKTEFKYLEYESLGGYSSQLSTVETDPILLTCSDDANDYLIMHKITGYITVINTGAYLQAKSGSYNGNRRYNLYNVSKSFAIGSIVVSSMAVLRRGNSPQIAVLYRDIDFNFSLRLYTFSSDFDFLTLERQMEVFSGAPSLVVAVPNGFLVASDLKLYFFSTTNKTTDLADNVGESSYPVSHNWEHDVVTLNMDAKKSSYLGMRFETSTQIDKNRHLLVSDSGITILVYLETVVTGIVTKVTQFQIVDLGKSTVASELIHIKDNLIYAGSTRSRSVIFRILPEPPFIDILSCVTNSSPILNMNLQKNDRNNKLLLCRGGFHNGELEIVTDSKYKIEVNSSTQVSANATLFNFGKAKKSDVLLLQDDSGEFIDCYELPSLGKSKFSNSDIKIHSANSEGQATGKWKIDDARTIEYVQRDGAILTLRCKKDISIILKDIDQVSNLVWHENKNIINVYVTSWSGVLVHLTFTETAATVIDTLHTRHQGKISMAFIDLDLPSTYMIVLVNADGLISEIPVFEKSKGSHQWDSQKTLYLKVKGSSGAFRISYSKHLGALVFDDYSIFLLCSNSSETTERLAFTKLHTFNHRIKYCRATAKSYKYPAIVALFDDGNLSHFTFQDRRGDNDLYSSQHLILSSLAVSTRHTIALQLKSQPNTSTGRMDRVVSLLLFDARSLKLLDVYEPPQGYKFVDMCLLEKKHKSKKDNWVVVANSGDDPKEYLKVFQVVSNKIKSVPGFTIHGEVPSACDFSSISSQENKVYLTGDVCVTFELLDLNTSGKKAWKANIIDHGNSSIYGSALAGNKEIIVLADAARGAMVSSVQKPYLYELSNPFRLDSTYATAIAVMKTLPIFIYGDAEGQIWCAKRTFSPSNESIKETTPTSDLRFETLFYARLKDLINHIIIVSEDPIVFLVATVKGNVFRVQDLASYPLAQAHIEQVFDNNSMNSMKLSQDERIFRISASGLFDARGLDLYRIYPREHFDEALKIDLANLLSETRSL